MELSREYEIVKIKTVKNLKIAYCYKNNQLLSGCVLNIVKITPTQTQKAILQLGYSGITTIKIITK